METIQGHQISQAEAILNTRKVRNVENIETDVVVIGGGGTGLAAAIAAAEKGAKVLVLEKRQVPGGNSVFPEGLFAVDSPLQKRMNIDARSDDFFKLAMNFSHYKINPRIIRAFINKSGDTIRWLEEKGVEFGFVSRSDSHKNIQTFHIPRGGAAELIEALVKNCEKLGLRILLETAAEQIITGPSQEITGVLATTGEKKIKIAARSVVIASGGYAGNKKLMNQYCPSYVKEAHLHGLPHMGDGLLMATKIGAATEGLGILHNSAPYYPWSHDLWVLAQEPQTLWVNKWGERFIDETVGFNHFESVNPVAGQPGNIAYTLFDEKAKRSIIEIGFVKGLGKDNMPGKKLPDLDGKLKSEAEKGRLKIADSWKDIAEWLGADPDILKATINEYNYACDRGLDRVFGKDAKYLTALHTPPYYAIKTYVRIISTIGGIRINQKMEALDQQDKPIPGLFAGGTDAGGWETDTYNLNLPGMAYGFAINSGRIAGENAAIYISTK
jgi:fumarate reductase flavoprotein subunit